MRKIAQLQIYQNMTFQNTMIKNEVYTIMCIIKSYAFLPCFKTKSLPKF